MKLLFVNQFYWPDVAATAQQLSDLAEFLADGGHEVDVLCSTGGCEAGATGRIPRREVRKNVTIRRVPSPRFGKRTTLGRVIDYAGFHLLCGLWLLLWGWRYRVIVTLTTPPLIGVYGTLVKWLTLGRTKHVCWCMDLHPDCEFELGLLNRGNPVWRMLDGLNALHFRQANTTVALGNCMKGRLLQKRVRGNRLRVISVWSRADHVQAVPDRSPSLRQRLGLENDFVIMYAGNAGVIHTFGAVCEAMRQLDGNGRFCFLFVGGGKRLKEIESFVQTHRLGNFRRLPYVPREELGEILALGDVHLVTMRPGMQGVAVCSKLYGIMAAGRPAVYVGPFQSETARQIAAADCGRLVAPDDGDSLARVIRELASDAHEVERLGENGRRYFLEHHERHVCCEQWEDLLETVALGKAA